MRYVLGACALVLVLAAPAGAAFSGGPANRTVPATIGIARVGERITSTSGTWSGSGPISYSYQWDRCDPSGNGCIVIAGATQPTYLLAAADVGMTIALTVTAKDSSGFSLGAASLLGPIAPASGIASIARPLISGTAAVGSTLTVSTGTWTTTPGSLTFAWLRCTASGRACASIAGATSATHVAGAADAGHALVVRVRAKSGTSSQDVLSLASAPVAAKSVTTTTTATTTATTTTTTTTTLPPAASASTRPAVSGTTKVGQRLTAPATAGAAYQWYRCDPSGAHCASIHGAVGAGYRLVAKDAAATIGLTIRVGTTPTYASLAGPVAAAGSPAASTVQPGVSGKPVQGQTLTASPGSWSGTTSALAYAWWRCNANGRICAPIAGAASASYVPVAEDVGHALVALVTATIGGTAHAALSVATDAIQPPPALAPAAPLVVTGAAKVGARLTGAAGTWTGTAPISFRYQWYRCDAVGAHCASVHGATATTYRLTAKDAGKTVGLTITATDGAGTKQPAYASLVGPVAAASAPLASTAQPRIGGSPAQGQTLTVAAGSWSSTPSSTTYAWARCNANGRVCTLIAGSTAASYTVTAADVGHALVAVVTAHLGSATATAFSTASAPAKT
jgi:large repetitive protein